MSQQKSCLMSPALSWLGAKKGLISYCGGIWATNSSGRKPGIGSGAAATGTSWAVPCVVDRPRQEDIWL